MKKRVTAMTLAVVMLLSLSGCGGEKSAPQADSGEPFAFTDDAGRQVEVAGEIEGIVPTAAMSQAILLAIAPDLLVGLASRIPDSARGILDEELFDLPCFGSLSSGATLNVEELAAVGPQLIIDAGEEKKSTAEDMDTLQQQTGIPAVFISTSLETMPDTFRTLGKLLGREERGEVLARFCERVYSRTVSIMEQVGENRVECLYVLGEEGLNVIAAGSYHAEVLDMLTENLAVVDNPVGKGAGNQVTMEQIALWDPAFVIFAPDSIYDSVEEMDAWSHVEAIRSGRFVLVPDNPLNWMSMPPSVQRYLGLIWLPTVLYPEYCDYDARAEIMEYYELFYGCALTGEQYETITEGAFITP